MPDIKKSPRMAKRSKRRQRKSEQDVQAPEPRGLAEVAQSSTRLLAAICLVLCLASAAVYWQTGHHGFIAYDDDQYVYENPHVQGGLTASGLAWAWTTFFYANWHPLTWMSLMLDYQLFGGTAGAFHVANVAWHMAGVVFLFLAFERMTRHTGRSAVVAGILALHPLHVESVAWISERKDVLSTALAMLALFLYVRYVERRSARRYVWVTLVFALGLAAKPMLVTFPFVLMLMDLWPLGRVGWPLSWPQLRPLVLEKIPLVAMAAICSVLTFMAQSSFGTVVGIRSFPLPARLANACIAYATYIWKAFWPFGLGVLYPSEPPDPGTALIAVVVLLAVTTAVLWTMKEHPYLGVGWLWYLGTLVPVIGLVQVGSQSIADRYTYVPLIGLSLAIVWGGADACRSRLLLRRASVGLATAVLLLLAIGAHRQAAYWRDSKTLFAHTLEVTKRNYIILNNLGVTLASDGQHDSAMADYRQAISINPDYGAARANLGHELAGAGKLDDAYRMLVEAVRLKPDVALAQGDLGTLLAARGNFDEARQHLQESLRLKPAHAEMQSNLCYVLQRLGRLGEALSHCDEALRLKPDLMSGHLNRGMALAAQGKNALAEAEFSRVLAANPDDAEASLALQRLHGQTAAR